MMLAEKVNVSVCLNQAYARMKGLLFPFDIQRWLTLGLCAWILTLGESGGGSGNWGRNWGKNAGDGGVSQTVLEKLNTLFWGEGTVFERFAAVLEMESATIQIIFYGAVLFLLVILAIALVIAYFQGRMNFVWLDNLLNDRSRIQPAYREYEKPGVDFFKGKLCIDIWFYLINLLLFGVVLYPGYQYLKESARVGEWGSFTAAHGTFLVLLGLLIAANVLVSVYLALLFTFVPLIMYKTGLGFHDAWASFNNMLLNRKIQFIKYLFFNWIVDLAAGVLIGLIVLCSCCILAIPLMLPVIGSTMLLPWYVLRSYLAIEFYEVLTGE